jgi:tagatose-1,6-bisphosphate aldolase
MNVRWASDQGFLSPGAYVRRGKVEFMILPAARHNANRTLSSSAPPPQPDHPNVQSRRSAVWASACGNIRPMPTLGVYRHLTQCSGADGTFCVLAIDHRDNLVAELQKHRTSPVAYEEVVAFKTSVARLSPCATAVLIDPDYGARALICGAIPGGVGALAPLEVTNYRPHPSQRKPDMIPDWSVTKLKRAGFAGAKLLLYYHPDADDAEAKTNLLDRVVAECDREQVPLFLEPITYSPDPSRELDNGQRREAVIAAARHFSRRGVAVMKMEFPIDVKADRRAGVDRCPRRVERRMRHAVGAPERRRVLRCVRPAGATRL